MGVGACNLLVGFDFTWTMIRGVIIKHRALNPMLLVPYTKHHSLTYQRDSPLQPLLRFSFSSTVVFHTNIVSLRTIVPHGTHLKRYGAPQ